MVKEKKKKISQADKIEWMLGLCVLIIAASAILQIEKEAVNAKEKTYTIVIDPGHGGKDPGKIGVDGQLEKNINLSISQKVKDKLEQRGAHVILTREKDATATGSEDSSKGEDMNARISVINQSKVDVCVSIHQNSYTSESVSGAQVFYYTNSIEGRSLAQLIQQRLVNDVDPDNTRKEKADISYYILLHSACPTVIVECGFLSNANEAARLEQEEYQQKVAEAICSGIMDYLSE